MLLSTVLIVEDDAVQRKLFARQLRNIPCTVQMAEDGFQALEVLRTTPVALVLLDIYLPRMNGVEVLEAIRANEQLSDVKVVIYTAGLLMLTPDERTLADCVLRKPITAQELEATIANLLPLTEPA